MLEPVLKTQSIIITINDIEVECRAICLFKVTPPDWNLYKHHDCSAKLCCIGLSSLALIEYFKNWGLYFSFNNPSEMRRRQSSLSTRAFLQIRDRQLMEKMFR